MNKKLQISKTFKSIMILLPPFTGEDDLLVIDLLFCSQGEEIQARTGAGYVYCVNPWFQFPQLFLVYLLA